MQTLRLGDVCVKIGSGATPRGGGDVYIESGVSLIRSQNIYNDGFHTDGLAFIGPKHAAELSGVEVRAGDVLLNITGDSVARSCRAPESVLPARVNQHVAIIRPYPNRLDARYLHYFLVSPSKQQSMLSLAGGGATRNALTKGMIENFEVPAPSIEEQRAMAEVLGSLDDKIEHNRRTARALERLARATFKAWFLDFEPVKAKASGRTSFPGMSAAAFAALPDRLTDSVLGPVPQGWENRSLYSVAKFINGAAFKSSHFCERPSGFPVVKIAELKSGITTQTEFSDRTDLDPRYRIDTGEMLYSWSGSPDTSLDTFLWTKGPGLLNQHIFRVVTESDAHKVLVYYLLKHLKQDLIEIARDKQTTGLGHVTVGDMQRLMVVWPDAQTLAAFHKTIGPLFMLTFNGMLETEKLATLRDYLLPRLLSGRVRVGISCPDPKEFP